MNIAEDTAYFTAEAWLVWTTLLAPELLHNRLDSMYYRHFLRLVTLIKNTMSFEFSKDELDELEKGWREWVLDYEQYAHMLG